MAPVDLPGNWVTEVQDEIAALSFKVDRTLFSGKSEYQRVEIVQTAGHGKMLLNDGLVMLSERDEFIYHEMIAHVPLFVHPAPRRVLIIGGGDGGTAREVLKHPTVEKVVLVEIDELVVRACREYFPEVAGALENPTVTLLFEDGVRYIAETGERFDVILIDSTDPIGPAKALFSETFYRNASRVLDDAGIMISQAESPFYHRDIQRHMLSSQRPFFERLHLYLMNNMTYPSGLWSFGFASKGICPVGDFDPGRVEASGIAFRYYSPGIHRASFVLPAFLAASLGKVLDPTG